MVATNVNWSQAKQPFWSLVSATGFQHAPSGLGYGGLHSLSGPFESRRAEVSGASKMQLLSRIPSVQAQISSFSPLRNLPNPSTRPGSCPLLPPPLTLAFLLCPEGSLLLGVLPPYSAWLVPSRHSRPCSNVISEWPFSTFSPHHPTFSSLHFPLSEIILLFIALTWFVGSVSPLESERHESREAVLFSHVYLASESVATSR